MKIISNIARIIIFMLIFYGIGYSLYKVVELHNLKLFMGMFTND